MKATKEVALQDSPAGTSLTRFFGQRIRRSLADLGIPSETVAGYLGTLLARFVPADQLYAIRDAAGWRLDSIAELLREAERTWDFRAADFNPLRERDVRQHIGDYALFMCGLFPERVARWASTDLYLRAGQHAYRVVADFERAALRPDARLFATLAAGFAQYAAALAYMRRVYLRPAEAPVALRAAVRWLITPVADDTRRPDPWPGLISD